MLANDPVSSQIPHVGVRDMGLSKPVKYFYWCPWPVWVSPKGTRYYTSRSLFTTKEKAEMALRTFMKGVKS